MTEEIQGSLAKFALALKNSRAVLRTEYIGELRDLIEQDKVDVKTLDVLSGLLDQYTIPASGLETFGEFDFKDNSDTENESE